jgi:hypothetical protein
VSPFSGDLELIEPDAAAVDVGSRSHWVAVNPQRDPNPVREFGTFTADLMSLVDWLAQCGAKSVVMEATGVYRVSLYELLERRPAKETIQKNLEGNWQEELLFDLKIALESYDHFQGQITADDEQIRQELKEGPSKVDLLQEPLPAARLRICRKRPGMSQQDQLDLREELYRIAVWN